MGPKKCSSEPLIIFCGLQAAHVVSGNHYVYTFVALAEPFVI